MAPPLLAPEANSAADESDHGSEASSSRSARYVLGTARIAIDVGEYAAFEYTKWLKETGHSFVNTCLDVFKVHVAILLQGTKGQPKLHTYKSPNALLTYLNKMKDLAPNAHVLLMVDTLEGEKASSNSDSEAEMEQNSDKKRYGGPCIDVPTFSRIASLYQLHPMVIHNIRKRSVLEKQSILLSDENCPDARDESASNRSLDLSCFMPLCWLDNSMKEDPGINHTSNFGTSVYTSLRDIRKGSITLYINMLPEWNQSVYDSWLERFQNATPEALPVPLDMLRLLANGVEELTSALHFQEFLTQLKTDLAVNDMVASRSREQVDRVGQMAKHLDILRAHNTDIEALAMINQSLENIVISSLQNSSCEGRLVDKQCRNWLENISTNLRVGKSKCHTLLSRSLDMQRMMVDIASVKNAVALNHNTEHMARLADANDQAGKEVALLTRQSREDSVLMKFFAEVTIVFLPITAVSTFFSMGFFAINNQSNAILPFDSIKYIWVFGIVAVVVSAATFGLWMRQHRHVNLEREKRDQAERSQEENAVISLANVRAILDLKRQEAREADQEAKTLAMSFNEMVASGKADELLRQDSDSFEATRREQATKSEKIWAAIVKRVDAIDRVRRLEQIVDGENVL